MPIFINFHFHEENLTSPSDLKISSFISFFSGPTITRWYFVHLLSKIFLGSRKTLIFKIFTKIQAFIYAFPAISPYSTSKLYILETCNKYLFLYCCFFQKYETFTLFREKYFQNVFLFYKNRISENDPSGFEVRGAVRCFEAGSVHTKYGRP